MRDATLKFENVTMRYREGFKPVLKDLSFEAEPRAKIGIVGRTGAGKSSILHTLLRLTETEPMSRISINGYDIRKVDLKSLR